MAATLAKLFAVVLIGACACEAVRPLHDHLRSELVAGHQLENVDFDLSWTRSGSASAKVIEESECTSTTQCTAAQAEASAAANVQTFTILWKTKTVPTTPATFTLTGGTLNDTILSEPSFTDGSGKVKNTGSVPSSSSAMLTDTVTVQVVCKKNGDATFSVKATVQGAPAVTFYERVSCTNITEPTPVATNSTSEKEGKFDLSWSRVADEYNKVITDAACTDETHCYTGKASTLSGVTSWTIELQANVTDLHYVLSAKSLNEAVGGNVTFSTADGTPASVGVIPTSEPSKHRIAVKTTCRASGKAEYEFSVKQGSKTVYWYDMRDCSTTAGVTTTNNNNNSTLATKSPASTSGPSFGAAIFAVFLAMLW